MPETDPFDLLREEAGAVPTPPASEIRARGERRRARHQASLATAVAGSMAVAVGVLAITTPWSTTNPQIAGTPSVASPTAPTPTAPPNSASSTPTASTATAIPSTSEPETTPKPTPTAPRSTPQETPAETTTSRTSTPGTTATTSQTPAASAPTFANLPGVELLFPYGAQGIRTSQYQGIGQAAKGICDQGNHGEYSSVVTREFTADDLSRSVQVFQYKSSEQAAEAAAAMEADASSCAQRLEGDDRYQTPRDDPNRTMPYNRTSPTGVRVEKLSYRMTLARLAGQDSGVFNETTVVHVGNRVVLAVDTSMGQDRNCEPTPSDVVFQCEVPAAINQIIALATRDMTP